jgi:GTPase SAR1 family protein
MVDKKPVASKDSSDEGSEPEHLQYKVVVLGNGTAGKTSLIMRFCEDYFARSYKQTIGVDFFVKRLEMPEDV